MIVYKVTNKINGKVYIGKTTKSLMDRWRSHCESAMAYGKISYLYNAIRKYGPDNFVVQELDRFRTENHLNLGEKWWISKLKTYKSEFGYNMTMGGDGGTLNAESRKRLSLAMKGIGLGTKRSIEIKQKLSQAHKGKPLSEQHKQMLSIAHKGKAPRPAGWHHSTETRIKMSVSRNGHSTSDETRSKISHANKGKPSWRKGTRMSEETKRKISISVKATKHARR